jgi:uncharacterized protein (DUF427 family)
MIGKGRYVMAKASWNGETIAESENCITTEGNLYFPPDSVKFEFLVPSETRYTCAWKGEAGYYDLAVNGKVLKDAAWYYYHTKNAAKSITNYVAFDKNLGVKIEGTASIKIEAPVRVR